MLWLGLWSSIAGAQMVPHGHEVPTSLRLPQKLRYTTAGGKVKDGGCEAAVAAALADLQSGVKASEGDHVIAIWPKGGRNAWEPTPDLECVDKGKVVKVDLEALIARSGPAPVYPEVSGQDVLKLIDALYGKSGGSFLFATQLSIQDFGGQPWLQLLQAPMTVEKPMREGLVAPHVLNENLIIQMHRYANAVASTPALAGLAMQQGVTVVEGDKKTHYSVEIRVPAAPLARFHKGEITERRIVDRSVVYFESPTTPRKIITVPPESIRDRK
ncbi:MAG: hypothetical protein R3F61_24300 [Myxococcota bacterium]